MRCQILVSKDNFLFPALRPDWTEGGIKTIIKDTRTVLTTHNDAG